MSSTDSSLTLQSCPRRRWGKSGLTIPVIPFGTTGFGDHFGKVTNDEAFALIRRAVDLGINHFDCARCYGNSLPKLGLALKEGVIRRDEVIISGRVCCHSAAPWGGYGEGEPDYSAERVAADVEDQLRLLHTDYFDALFIHDPGKIEPTLASGGTLEGVHRLKEQGMTRNAGYGMRPHAFHLAALETGGVDVFLFFGDHNLLRQTGEELLTAAAARDVGVMHGWSIMRGMLTGVPVENVVARDRWLPGDDAARAEAMRLWCEERGISLLNLAIQFCLKEQRIHGHPLASINIEQLEANLAAVLNPISESVFEEFEQAGI